MCLPLFSTRRAFCLALGAGWASAQSRVFASALDPPSVRQTNVSSLDAPPAGMADVPFAEAFIFLAEQDGWTLVMEPYPARRSISGEKWGEFLKIDTRTRRLDWLAAAFDYVVVDDRHLTPGLRILRKQYRYVEEDPQLPLDIQYPEWQASLSELDRIMASFPDWGLPGDWLVLHLIPSLAPEQSALMEQSKLTVASLSLEQKKIVYSMTNAFHTSGVQAKSGNIPRELFDEKVWSESLITVEEMQDGRVRLSLVKPEKREYLTLIGQAPKPSTKSPLSRKNNEGQNEVTASLTEWAQRLPRPVNKKSAQFSAEIADKTVAITASKKSGVDYYRIWFAVAELYGLAVDSQEDTGLFRLRRATAKGTDTTFGKARSCLPLSINLAFWIGSLGLRSNTRAKDDSSDGKHTIHNRVDFVPKHLLERVAEIALEKIADTKVPTQPYVFNSKERSGSEPPQSVARNGWAFPVSYLSAEEKAAVLGYLTAYVVANSATLLFRTKTPEYITRVDELILSGRSSQNRNGRKQFEIAMGIADGPNEKIRSLLNATFNLEIDRYKGVAIP